MRSEGSEESEGLSISKLRVSERPADLEMLAHLKIRHMEDIKLFDVAPIPKWTEAERKGQHVTCQVSQVRCHVSLVVFRMSPVSCHLSLTPRAIDTDPPPAKSLNMHSRLVHKDPKTLIILKQQKIIETAKT